MKKGGVVEVLRLIDNKADVHSTDNVCSVVCRLLCLNFLQAGETVLHKCVAIGSVELALALVLHTDVKASATNKDNKSAVMLAREAKQDELAQVLSAAETFQRLPSVDFQDVQLG